MPSGFVFLALLARFGLAMTNAGEAFSTGFEKFDTALTSVGIAVDEYSDRANAVSGSSKGGGASTGAALMVGTADICTAAVSCTEDVDGSATGFASKCGVSVGVGATYGAEYSCATVFGFLVSEASPLYAAAKARPTPKAKPDSSRSISNPIMSYLFLSTI